MDPYNEVSSIWSRQNGAWINLDFFSFPVKKDWLVGRIEFAIRKTSKQHKFVGAKYSVTFLPGVHFRSFSTVSHHFLLQFHDTYSFDILLVARAPSQERGLLTLLRRLNWLHVLPSSVVVRSFVNLLQLILLDWFEESIKIDGEIMIHYELTAERRDILGFFPQFHLSNLNYLA